MTERLWCPNCETGKYHFDHSDNKACRECEHELVDPPTKVKTIWKLKQVGALFILLSIFIMPIGWVILNIGQKPLYATKTVTITQTQPYGILPAIAPVVFIWLFLYICYLYMGYMPR